MKKNLLLIAFFSVALSISSQEFSVPKDYKMNVEADYRSYEQDILKAIEWLENTPTVDQTTKRKDANAFLMVWITGCPYLTLSIGDVVLPLLENENSQNFMIFFGGWIKYALTNKDYDNQVNGNVAGIESVINFYEKNKKWTGKDTGVEKYIKMKKKGTLNKYVKDIVEKEQAAEKTKIK